MYNLTSTYFECDAPDGGKRKFGYSRDKRSDCVQVVIALIVTKDGFPLAYEVMDGNTSDKTTLKAFLAKIEKPIRQGETHFGNERGFRPKKSLAEMRSSDPPVQYLVGTPRGRLTKLEKAFIRPSPGKKRAQACASSWSNTRTRLTCLRAATGGATRSNRCAGAACAS